MSARSFWWLIAACAVTVAVVVIALTWVEYAAPVVLALVVLVVAAVILRRRFRLPEAQAPSKWAVELVALPLVLALHVQNVMLAAVGVTALLIVALFRRGGGGSVSRRSYVPVIALFVGAGMVIARNTDQYELWIAAATTLLILQCARTVPARKAATSLLDGVYLYVIANVVGYYILGLTSPAASARLSGLEATAGAVRVFFPFTTSLNLAPAMAACAVAASVLLVERGWKRWYRFAGLASAAVILVASNARLALITAALVTVLLTFAPRIGRVAAPVIAIASLGIAFVFAPLSEWMAGVAPDVIAAIPGLDRGGGAQDLLTLNSRNVIWDASLQFWSQSLHPFEMMFGLGPLGQYTSGASGAYAWVFTGGLAQAATASTHNSVVQQMYDGGLIGLAIYLFGLIAGLVAAVRLAGRSRPWAAASVGAMSSIILSGATEVTFAPGYQQETFWVLVGLAVFAIRGKGADDMHAPFGVSPTARKRSFTRSA